MGSFAGTGGQVVSSVDPTEKYSRSFWDATKEVGRQLVGGVAVDLPHAVGQGLRWLNAPGTVGDRAGESIVAGADSREPDFEPNDIGAGVIGKTASMGARAVGPMIPTIAASMVPGVGAVAGPAMAGALFGTSSAQDTKDKLQEQGVSDADATKAGWLSGAIQGPMEALATHVGASAFRAGKLALGAEPTMDGVVKALTNSAVVKPFAKAMGLNMLVEPATEVAQDLGTEFVERAYGAKPEDAWQIAKNSAQGAIGLTALLGPFAAGAHMSHAKRSQALDAALNNPAAPPEIRQMAENMVMEQAKEAGVPAEQITAWKAERAAQGADTTTETVVPPGADLLAGGKPVDADNAAIVAANPPVAPPVAVQPNSEVATPPTDSAQPTSPSPAEAGTQAVPGQAAVSPASLEGPAAEPGAGVDPAVAAQQAQEAQAAQVQQQAVEEKKAAMLAEQGAVADAENTLGGPERDTKGKRVIKVPGNYVETFRKLGGLLDAGKIDQAQFDDGKHTLIAALQTQDFKSLNEVRKSVDALLAPKVEATPAKPAQTSQVAPIVAPVAEVAKPAEAPIAAPVLAEAVKAAEPTPMLAEGEKPALSSAAPAAVAPPPSVVVRKDRKTAALMEKAAEDKAKKEAAAAEPAPAKPAAVTDTKTAALLEKAAADKAEKDKPPPDDTEPPSPVAPAKPGAGKAVRVKAGTPTQKATHTSHPRAETPILPTFEHLPDLADAIAHENNLPQAISDAYAQHLDGRSHQDIATDLGVGKTTVGDWLKKFVPLVDDAKLLRHVASRPSREDTRAAPGEIIAPDARAETEHVEGEHAAADQEGEMQAPTVNEDGEAVEGSGQDSVHGEYNSGGELSDEDNHNPYQSDADLSDKDGNINISDSPHGEGKTSADNNIDKARKATLAKRWDKLNDALPEDHRVAFKDLGSAQQDAFDSANAVRAKESTGAAAARVSKAHDAISKSAHEGARYSQKTDIGGLLFGKDDVPSALGTHEAGSRQSWSAARAFDAVTTAVKDVLKDGAEKFSFFPLRRGNTTSDRTAAAIAELSSHPTFGPFFTRAFHGLDQLGMFTENAGNMLQDAVAFFSAEHNLVAFNAAFGGATSSAVSSVIAHEAHHKADYVSGEALMPGQGLFASQHDNSKTATDLTVDPDGTTDHSRGTVMNEAMNWFEGIRDPGNMSEHLQAAYTMLEYPLRQLRKSQSKILAAPLSQRWDVFDAEHAELRKAENHAVVELGPVLTQLALEYPALAEHILPLGFAHVQHLMSASEADQHQAFLENSRESDNGVQTSQAGVASGRVDEVGGRVPGQVRGAAANALDGTRQGVRGADQARDGDRRPGHVDPSTTQARRDGGGLRSAGGAEGIGSKKSDTISEREAQSGIIQLRKRKSVLDSLLGCLG